MFHTVARPQSVYLLLVQLAIPECSQPLWCSVALAFRSPSSALCCSLLKVQLKLACSLVHSSWFHSPNTSILMVPKRILWPPLSLVRGVEGKVNLDPLRTLLGGGDCVRRIQTLPFQKLSCPGTQNMGPPHAEKQDIMDSEPQWFMSSGNDMSSGCLL